MSHRANFIVFIITVVVVGLLQLSNSREERVSYASSPGSASNGLLYESPAFDKFVQDSLTPARVRDAKKFYAWMDHAYASSAAKFPGKGHLTLEQLLARKRRFFSRIKDSNLRMHSEIAFASWLHKMVKSTIPRFSLDRGFEFANTMKYGERQCFLQSVLIAGILQDVGLNAGVVMVYRNIRGEETNNGHAVALLKLSNGQDIIVDASEPEPFARHQGLFARTGDYVYVMPVYATNSHKIRYYRKESGGRLSAAAVKTLDYAFVRSQFYYYRGERAVGGILSSNRTTDGLRRSEKDLRTSVKLCPRNPLAVYMLGRVYLAEGNEDPARTTILQANDLYARFGWVPAGAKEYLSLVDGGNSSRAQR